MNAPPRPYTLGVQSYTYREFDVEEMCSQLAQTDVDAVELCHEHVLPDDDTTRLDDVRERLADVGLDVCGYGVVGFDDADETEIHQTLATADRLGAEYCSLDIPPGDVALRDRVCAVSAEFDLELAIHNHGPGATYDTVDDVIGVLDDTTNLGLGACVDTGHYLRSGEDPVDVVTRLGDRVRALHLKDFLDVETEAVPGAGNLDIPTLVQTLTTETTFSQPLVVEYEADPTDPTPAVTAAAEAVSQATR